MGSPPGESDRKPTEVQHAVEITQPLYLGKYEVTQRQFLKVMGTNPSAFSPTGFGLRTWPGSRQRITRLRA